MLKRRLWKWMAGRLARREADKTVFEGGRMWQNKSEMKEGMKNSR